MPRRRTRPDRRAARNLLRQPSVKPWIQQVTDDVAGHAKDAIGAGDFAGSLSTSVRRDPTRIVGVIESDDPGFFAIEFGTTDQAPKAPLRRAIDRAGLRRSTRATDILGSR